ncbi:enoyl-CoA hydratase/isomerase family protein [Rhodococcus qingshengii]|uniref:enoyl-CoA hydratase/isomerase family protein n=1 Tax=Rhodococcus qingshengii TaxID=334542 RepID=UPI00237C6CCD|nr:enoyl-CoA hydratase-related protein [Rhodococcus qingshengii]WCT06034.1 enoyl-CoA hydratase-related protein [Rhodococcus qingshengii]
MTSTETSHDPTIAAELSAHQVLVITLDRPALTTKFLTDTARAVEDAAQSPGIRLIVLAGRGAIFCVGADLHSDSAEDPAQATILLESLNRLVSALRHAPQLVVAAVNGPAVGGGLSLVLAADLVIANTSAYLKAGFTEIGLLPDGGLSATLTHLIGPQRALAMTVLNTTVDAELAHRLGIYAQIWPPEIFHDRVSALIGDLAAGPTHAYSATKRAIHRAAAELDTALAEERREQSKLLQHRDFSDSVRAFRAKHAASVNVE